MSSLFIAANATGVLRGDLNAPNPLATFNNGIAFSPAGKIYVTITTDPNDSYIGGLRVSPLGQLVVGGEVVSQRPYVANAGILGGKLDGVTIFKDVGATPPVTDDPYVNGVRVNELNGVYVSSVL